MLALFGQMLFGALCGLEYIAILAGESRDPARTIGRSVVLSSPVICAMFILGTASIVALVPRARIDFIAPIPQAMRMTLGNSGIANIAAIVAILLLQFRLLGATSYLFTGVTRLPMAAGWNHLVPEWFTRLHPRRATPTNSILCTTAIAFGARAARQHRRSRAGGLPTPHQRQPDALRGRLSRDVRDPAGRSRLLFAARCRGG